MAEAPDTTVARWQMIAAVLASLSLGGGAGSILSSGSTSSDFASTHAAVAHNTALLSEVRGEVRELRDQLAEHTVHYVSRAELAELERRVRELEQRR